MLLAQEPKLLLVDEPVAGMTDAETEADRRTAQGDRPGPSTVVVVEHDMTFVRELGVKVTCLHEGSVLAEGTIDQVSDERAGDRSLSGTVTMANSTVRLRSAPQARARNPRLAHGSSACALAPGMTNRKALQC